MKIVLVRHGQTPANRLGALDTVRPGLGLTEEGLAQARRLADRWEGEVAAPPTLIALSGLHRTRLTAAPLAARYGLTPLVCPGIRELRSGDLEMASDPASQMEYVRTTLSWCAGNLDNRMPGGESGCEALARSLETVRRVGLAAREQAGGSRACWLPGCRSTSTRSWFPSTSCRTRARPPSSGRRASPRPRPPSWPRACTP